MEVRQKEEKYELGQWSDVRVLSAAVLIHALRNSGMAFLVSYDLAFQPVQMNERSEQEIPCNA